MTGSARRQSRLEPRQRRVDLPFHLQEGLELSSDRPQEALIQGSLSQKYQVSTITASIPVAVPELTLKKNLQTVETADPLIDPNGPW